MMVMRRVLAVLLLVLVAVLPGCRVPGEPAAPPPSSPAATTPAGISMPDVVGQNAAVALDALKKTGFENIDLGTTDGRRVVILPQNWTVETQSAKPGTELAPDAKVVLGCAGVGGSRWPWEA